MDVARVAYENGVSGDFSSVDGGVSFQHIAHELVVRRK